MQGPAQLLQAGVGSPLETTAPPPAVGSGEGARGGHRCMLALSNLTVESMELPMVGGLI